MAEIRCPSCSTPIIDEGAEFVQCDHCGHRFGRHDGPAHSRSLHAPATGLIVVGVLGMLGNCLCGLASVIPPAQPALLGHDDIGNAAARGRRVGALLSQCAIVLSALSVYPFLIHAGNRLRQRRSYNQVMAAAILAMLPCSLVFVIGIPVGIWVLATIRAPENRSAFAS